MKIFSHALHIFPYKNTQNQATKSALINSEDSYTPLQGRRLKNV
jgi:hypothetical protein